MGYVSLQGVTKYEERAFLRYDECYSSLEVSQEFSHVRKGLSRHQTRRRGGRRGICRGRSGRGGGGAEKGRGRKGGKCWGGLRLGNSISS